PLLLITTATANTFLPLDEPPEPDDDGFTRPKDLMKVYEERSFRFCFTNRDMARAVVDFVWETDELRPRDDGRPPAVFPLEWFDDPYSVDLSQQFRCLFAHDQTFCRGEPFDWPARWGPRPELVRPPEVRYSVGGFWRPNRREAEVA